MKPEAPVPSEIALQAARALQRGWFGFHVGGVRETWAAPVWVVVGVRETRAAPAFRNCPSNGVCPAAGVVWVSAGVGAPKRGWSGFRGLHQPRLPSEPTAPPGRSRLHPDQACRPMGGVTTHGSVGRARRPSIPSARAMSLARRAPETPRDSPMKATTSEADHPRSRRSCRVTAPSRLARRAPERESARGTCAYVGTGAPSRWASCA